ncbi:hypothetical protein ARMGADRAFT_1031224 [Armillaria gallica]|uniref:Reverse transcriptase domain-containing protein n=1 Tax=Armillaria gallica TaxID=47427 RepID=A0A2H3DND4_ARMGA|nr:hypothetical protein ARMGADRAFT_1031224 [Armillaria gallica]
MYKHGAGGALFDWLRAMYSRMRYCIKMGDTFSHTFDSNIGILAGDGTSPSVWDFFGSDFTPCPHPDDVVFGNRQVFNVEHADDGALWSTSLAGIQFHCNNYGPWTQRKGLLINYGKTKALIFGKHPHEIPTITLLNTLVEWTDDMRFLGVVFCSTAMDIFCSHSIQLAKKALHICNVTCAMERFLGDIHPCTGLSIYGAHLDLILTYGAQIVIVTADSTLQMGFTPIRYRRLILALTYLLRLLSGRTSSKLAPCGLEACSELVRLGKRNWLTDITMVLGHLYHLIHVNINELLSPDQVHELVKSVDNIWKDELVDLITGSPTTSLLSHRFAFSQAPSAVFRLYLDMRVPAHRVALTHTLMGTHPLTLYTLSFPYGNLYHCSDSWIDFLETQHLSFHLSIAEAVREYSWWGFTKAAEHG